MSTTDRIPAPPVAPPPLPRRPQNQPNPDFGKILIVFLLLPVAAAATLFVLILFRAAASVEKHFPSQPSGYSYRVYR